MIFQLLESGSSLSFSAYSAEEAKARAQEAKVELKEMEEKE